MSDQFINAITSETDTRSEYSRCSTSIAPEAIEAIQSIMKKSIKVHDFRERKLFYK